MQEEPISIIKLDASSRFAGALKGDDVLLLLRVLNNAAYGSLRLAPLLGRSPAKAGRSPMGEN